MKKIVHFTKAKLFTWPGTNCEYANVWPINHPDTSLVTNGEAATTSVVLNSLKDADGNLMEFETQNTIYRFKAV